MDYSKKANSQNLELIAKDIISYRAIDAAIIAKRKVSKNSKKLVKKSKRKVRSGEG